MSPSLSDAIDRLVLWDGFPRTSGRPRLRRNRELVDTIYKLRLWVAFLLAETTDPSYSLCGIISQIMAGILLEARITFDVSRAARRAGLYHPTSVDGGSEDHQSWALSDSGMAVAFECRLESTPSVDRYPRPGIPGLELWLVRLVVLG
jgi:hypothetical protein